jgi:hypothetical protein
MPRSPSSVRVGIGLAVALLAVVACIGGGESTGERTTATQAADAQRNLAAAQTAQAQSARGTLPAGASASSSSASPAPRP